MLLKKGFAPLSIIVILLLTFSIFAAYNLDSNRGKMNNRGQNALLSQNPTEDDLSKGLASNSETTESENILGTTTAIPTSNSLPTSGYSRQKVTTERGTFTVSIVTANLNSAKVVVDTASNGNCSNDCPVLSLRDYVTRSGAFAGINGPYFCPATYSSCGSKKNSFDTLLMNKNKVYFNSDNNVYSTVPAAIFYGNTSRFVGQSLEWGRDTGVDSVIANYPLLVRDGNVNFTGSGDGKLNGKGNRSFIGAKDNFAYIGVVSSASVADAAVVLKTMGMKNALNLDSGGSTALWFGGYKFGPGRGIPFGILFVRK